MMRVTYSDPNPDEDWLQLGAWVLCTDTIEVSNQTVKKSQVEAEKSEGREKELMGTRIVSLFMFVLNRLKNEVFIFGSVVCKNNSVSNLNCRGSSEVVMKSLECGI